MKCDRCGNGILYNNICKHCSFELFKLKPIGSMGYVKQDQKTKMKCWGNVVLNMLVVNPKVTNLTLQSLNELKEQDNQTKNVDKIYDLIDIVNKMSEGGVVEICTISTIYNLIPEQKTEIHDIFTAVVKANEEGGQPRLVLQSFLDLPIAGNGEQKTVKNIFSNEGVIFKYNIKNEKCDKIVAMVVETGTHTFLVGLFKEGWYAVEGLLNPKGKGLSNPKFPLNIGNEPISSVEDVIDKLIHMKEENRSEVLYFGMNKSQYEISIVMCFI